MNIEVQGLAAEERQAAAGDDRSAVGMNRL
jgi:hypothetical protein